MGLQRRTNLGRTKSLRRTKLAEDKKNPTYFS